MATYYYYIKSGGTAAGDAGRVVTTPRTGTFAAKAAVTNSNIEVWVYVAASSITVNFDMPEIS